MIFHIKSKKEVSSVYNNLCLYYTKVKEFSKALSYNDRAIFYTEDTLTLYKNYFCRGNIYYFFAQYDSAIYYCQKAMESKNLYTQYASGPQLTNSLRSIDSADSALYRKKAHDIREEIEKQKSEEVIMRLLQKSTQDKLRNEKNLAVLYITFVFLALFFSGFTFYRKYNRQKLLKKEYLISLKETELTVEQEQTHTLRKELEESKQIINYADLKKQKQQEEEKIVSSIIQIGEECAMCFQKDLFFKNIVGKLSEGSIFANEEREVLIRKFCQYFTPYIQEISKYFQLAEEDYFVCCLTLLGFSTKYCAICRGVGEAAIRVQRCRIKEKLKGLFHPEKLYNSIFNKR